MRLTIGYSTTHSTIAKLIRRFTRSTVSHTYVRFFDPFLETEFVFHSDWPGVIVEDWKLFRLQNQVINEFEIDHPGVKASIQKNLEMLRKKYARWNLLRWAWFITFKRWIKRKVKNPTENPKEIICVDFTLHITNRANITALPYDTYVPDTLMNWMIDNHKQCGLTWTIIDGQPNAV